MTAAILTVTVTAAYLTVTVTVTAAHLTVTVTMTTVHDHDRDQLILTRNSTCTACIHIPCQDVRLW